MIIDLEFYPNAHKPVHTQQAKQMEHVQAKHSVLHNFCVFKSYTEPSYNA